MGANISMDVSAGLASAADATNTNDTTAAQSSAFEDKLRQEVILVPEDLVDIHIQASDTADAAADAAAAAEAADADADAPANHTRYGKGKHWKKNLKKKQGADAAAANTVPPIQTERTIEQRREQVRPIIDKLTELQMNVSYPAIRELYKKMSEFIRTGEDAKIKIPFPEFSRRIKGELTNATYKPCWVKLEME
jgi:chemotaxis protein histidine kinase CheA